MIESITLANFKSFGEEQTIPLEPITVLVGPNNSGKSNFMSVARFLGNCMVANVPKAIGQEGDFLFHLPRAPGDSCQIRWAGPGGAYFIIPSPKLDHPIASEGFDDSERRLSFYRSDTNYLVSSEISGHPVVDKNELLIYQHAKLTKEQRERAFWLWSPFFRSKTIKLSMAALRSDAEVVPQPEIGLDGRGLAAVLGLWRGAEPEKVDALNTFMARCLPEMKDVLVRPAPVPGHQRLWFRQKDGLEVDAEHVSDGVLAFTALAMHALSSEQGQLLCIEEPEQSIHPKRLRELVDLLKDLVRERSCQFIIATHSTVLLNAFRDEPESILLFRRSEKGTRVKRLSDVPELVEALQQAPPGDLLETGAFSTAF
ncbi:ATP-binding protein [Corallococcus exercitus]|uniref:ATP-binding protein n=1 Tax=Corallococcus exercitus TaxID=2316736 RepID=A0A7Y4NWE9_9BACT|nr:AAA family ATPase [Corallococcus exercitus]NOK39594.1 ATP-binding protein [Corallococcus exercitus]